MQPNISERDDMKTPQTLRNLANIMASHEDLLINALAIDRLRTARYCRTVDPKFLELLNKKKPKTMSALADIWYKSHGADYGRSQHYNDSRYHQLYGKKIIMCRKSSEPLDYQQIRGLLLNIIISDCGENS